MATQRTTNNSPDICQACSGRGFQMNIQTGINEVCPVCKGTRKSGDYTTIAGV